MTKIYGKLDDGAQIPIDTIILHETRMELVITAFAEAPYFGTMTWRIAKEKGKVEGNLVVTE